MRIVFGIFFTLPLILSSCASSLKNPYPSQAPDSAENPANLKAIVKANESRWARREQIDSLKAFIDTQREILRNPARRERDFILMARAEYLLAEYFSETTIKKMEHFAEAANWAEMALLQNQDYHLAQKGTHPETALHLLRKKHMEGLFWHALALAKWAELSGVGTALKYRNRIQSMMERVRQLRPDYFHGGVHRFFGAHFGLLPGLQEEDLALSRKHFELALRTSPDFFANHVSFAEIYGKKVDNAGLVRKHLEIAARGDVGRFTDFRPEQVLEQRRARKLLKGESP